MLLVDTSVWIEVFRRPSRFQLESVGGLDEVVTCLPIIHHDRDYSLLARVSPLKEEKISV